MQHPLTLRAIIFGLLLGIVFSFIAIYLYLKIGIVALGGIFLIGYLLLSITGRYDAKENAIILTIVGACMLASMGFLDPIVSLIVYKSYVSSEIAINMLLLISLIAPGIILGIFVLYPLQEEFVKLKWPMVTPMAYMVKVLEKTGSKELKYALRGMAFSTVTSASLMLSDLYQIDLSGARSNRRGLSFTSVFVSPLYASIGFFISYLGYIFMMIGVGYSMFIWFFFEGGKSTVTFQQHFFNPYIYSVAIPMMLTTAILTLVDYGKKLRQTLSLMGQESRAMRLMSILSLGLLPVLSYIFLSVSGSLPTSKLIEVVEIITVALPIVFMSAIFSVRAAGETGFSTSFTLDATLITVLLLFAPSFESIMIAFAIIGVFESMAISLIRRIKFCSIMDIESQKVIRAVLIEGIAGALFGPWIFLIINSYQGGVGSDLWPAPMAKLLGGYVLLFYIGIKNRMLPPMINPELLILSVVLTIVMWFALQLKKIKLSPILIAIGIVIPPSFLWIASIGALIDYMLFKKYGKNAKIYGQEKSKWNAALAGVMSGEGFVIFALTLISILPLIVGFP